MGTAWAATALALPPGEACAAFPAGEDSLHVPTLSTSTSTQKGFVSACTAQLTRREKSICLERYASSALSRL